MVGIHNKYIPHHGAKISPRVVTLGPSLPPGQVTKLAKKAPQHFVNLHNEHFWGICILSSVELVSLLGQ